MAERDNAGGGRIPQATVLRPMPGGSPGVRPPTVAPMAAAPQAQPPISNAAVEDFVARSANPLLAAAGPLLSLGVAIGASAYQADVEGLRSRAYMAVKAFETQVAQSGVPADQARFARYIVCAFVDNAVMQTPWGGGGVWAPRALLVQLEENLRSGVVFFEMLTRFTQQPEAHLDLLELQYVCLALGFQGRYRQEADGATTLATLQNKLYRLIRDRRLALGPVLATHWQGLAEPKPKAWRLVPWWVTAVAAACVVFAALVFLRTQLSGAAAEFNALLASRSDAVTDYKAAVPAAGPNRLKQLLAPEERAQDVAIDELGAKTVVTVTLPDLFQSGSARVAPGHEALFASIARALEQVPGHIIIAGHTDDQPVRSLSYDNDRLSELRAMAVADLIKPGLSNPGRLETVGFGASRPRYQPPSLPDNRARNRRVEIQHTAAPP